jgi:NTE family protein
MTARIARAAPAGLAISLLAACSTQERPAAFGPGLLQEFKATRLGTESRQTTLLDETGLIGGASGGSVLAGHA